MAEKLLTATFTMPNGKRKYVRAKTKEELEKKLLDLKIQMNAGIDISDDTRFDEWVHIWWQSYELPHLRPSTAASLKPVVNLIIGQLGRYKLRDIKPLHIQSMLAGLTKDYAKGTQRRVISYLRSIFKVAVENGLIVKSPVPDSAKPVGETKKVQPLTAAQEQTLRETVKDTVLYPFVILGLTTGMRSGELRGLQWCDVDLAHRVLHVRHNYVNYCVDGASVSELTDTPKTDAGFRDILIPAETVRLLSSLPRTSSFVVTNRYGAPMTFSDLASALYTLNTRLDYHFHPHMMRHTYATRLIASGADPKTVQYLLGHASIDMTMRVYASYCQESQRERTTAMVNAAFG